MLSETLDGLRIPKIGFGTSGIGGGMLPNRSRDPQGLAALRSSLDLGYTHFDTAEMYAAGHTEQLLGRAIKESGVARESLFITSKVGPQHLGFDAVLRSCEGSLRRLGMDYIDLYLIHWPLPGMRLSEVFRALNKLVDDALVRHLGVSNFDIRLLAESRRLSATPILTDQVPYSLNDRSYVRKGVLDYCQANSILLTAYSPLNQGWFKSNKALNAVAAAHAASPQQIALAWLVSQSCVITIPMSQDPAHQKQNLDALDIHLTEQELAQLA